MSIYWSYKHITRETSLLLDEIIISAVRHAMRHLFHIVGAMFFASITAENLDKTTFIPTLKPMYCHNIQISSARSLVECALKCQSNFYPCLGYIVTRHISSEHGCQICFIFDIRRPMAIAPAPSNNVTGFMPVFNKQDGEYTDQTSIWISIFLIIYIFNYRIENLSQCGLVTPYGKSTLAHGKALP